jgi:hypothetical protein
MHAAYANLPAGRAFNDKMGQWLREHGFAR